MPLTRQEIAADLAMAMRLHLKGNLRPADIGAIAMILAECPTLACWVVERRGVGSFGDMNPP